MRWLPYFLLAYLMLGLQVGAGPYLRYQGATPNFVLLAVVFISMNAPRDAALLGSFSLGVMQDLLSAQPPGLYAFSYGLAAMFIVNTHNVVYREHPLTHAALAVVAGLMTAVVMIVHGWLHPPGARVVENGVVLGALGVSPSTEFVRVVYTAALSPIVVGLLQRMKRLFAFTPPRRKIRAW